MIKGFEDYTHELTAEEIEMLPLIVKGLERRVGKDQAVKNDNIVKGMRQMGYKLNGARVRKLINVIRRYGLVKKLIATSKGYYVATTLDEVKDYIESLKEREQAIREVRRSLEEQIETSQTSLF